MMKTLLLEKEFTYDGTQLHSLYAYLEHGLLGNSCVAWIGPCSVSFEHMVDGEDLLARETIAGQKMLHFIVEVFDQSLFSAVALQRLFAAIVRDYLAEHSGKEIFRDGDDLFYNEGKISISIASKSPVSVMIHFAVNVTNEGTPVKTASLVDLGIDPVRAGTELLSLLSHEFKKIVEATHKVRPLS